MVSSRSSEFMVTNHMNTHLFMATLAIYNFSRRRLSVLVSETFMGCLYKVSAPVEGGGNRKSPSRKLIHLQEVHTIFSFLARSTHFCCIPASRMKLRLSGNSSSTISKRFMSTLSIDSVVDPLNFKQRHFSQMALRFSLGILLPRRSLYNSSKFENDHC